MATKLNASDCKTVRHALFLAIEWEKSIVDAYTPTFGKPNASAMMAIAAAERNMEKFSRIGKLLEKGKTDGG